MSHPDETSPRAVDNDRIMRATTPLPGLHRIEHIMGTAIDIDVRDAFVAPAALDLAFDYLRQVDTRFSTYRPDSEVSRLIRGELAESDVSPELGEVLELCERVRLTSEGYFDIRAHRPDGRPDPTGLVKGWSLENAGRILEDGGARNYCINGGGDIVIRGEPLPGTAWRVGVRHPLEADKLATVLEVREGAVATSGAYERGDHVLDPFTGKPPKGVLSLTVVGPSLTYADAYATAAFAMGPTGLAWIAHLEGYYGCSIPPTQTARTAASPGRRASSAGSPRGCAGSKKRSTRPAREALGGAAKAGAGIPIPVGAFDAHWDAIGAGCREGDVVNVVGTSTCIIAMSPKTQLIPGVCGVVPGSVHPKFTGIEAGLSATGDIFEAIARRAGTKVAELSKGLESYRPGQTGLLRITWDNGDRTVLVNPELGGVTLGWNLVQTAQDELFAAIEGTAFHTRIILERMAEHGVPVDRVINAGGIPQHNAVLNQVYANVLNKPVVVPDGVPTSLGSGIFASLAAGAFKTIEEAQEKMCLPNKSYVPEPAAAAVYERLFALYKTVYFALGLPNAEPTQLGHVLPELRKIAAEASAAGKSEKQ